MLTEAELEQHCGYILSDSRIRNNIVVLCEGVRANEGERLSPQLYSRMEELPDANFYRKCIRSTWNQKPPRFFNCGDRQDTLNSYFKLLEIHDDPKLGNPYFSPDLLFALVDIDLQPATIDDENYGFADTELIFHDLYQDLKLRPEKLPQHRIWVTGFKHKEAYFLNPDLQPIFDEYESKQQILNPDWSMDVNLSSIYQEMLGDLLTDADLKQHFTRAMKRICHCDRLQTDTIESLSQSWQELWNEGEAIDPELIFALLAIVKSKPYWKQVLKESRQRYSLSLEIAREFYAKQNGDRCPSYHLPCFFRYLYDFWQDRRAIDR